MASCKLEVAMSTDEDVEFAGISTVRMTKMLSAGATSATPGPDRIRPTFFGGSSNIDIVTVKFSGPSLNAALILLLRADLTACMAVASDTNAEALLTTIVNPVLRVICEATVLAAGLAFVCCNFGVFSDSSCEL